MTTQTKSRLIVFVLSALVWWALTDIGKIEEALIGVIVAAIVSLLAGKFLLTAEKPGRWLRRLKYALIYFFHFLWEMVKANFHVAYLVIHPMTPIKPGIVRIKTKLTGEIAQTVLANSITLTPGTLTVDIDPQKQLLYIHWIDMKSTALEESTEQIAGRFQNLLLEVFE
ncbi:MAG TPA: Na+/H+ antiporter subunit E [bacterium]|nr:Na+/H+ antiporter subunit E [bacterium]HNT65480.1 Na+/H+ antiporter subunit E [bacterium]HOX87545.1 Na+/H+ antiporter subunit E [bacterium]HPG47271.1 Na+/H+ antiporter subunit E [bacterium]HPM99523.1 Na+/H+ antiporter subunit E [bacterium]